MERTTKGEGKLKRRACSEQNLRQTNLQLRSMLRFRRVTHLPAFVMDQGRVGLIVPIAEEHHVERRR